ncbi:MAG: ABC transporter permease, partial [Chryseotalea sp.]
NEDPVGKILSWNDQFELEVTGVFKDYPIQSHVQFDFLISYPSIFETRRILSNGQETIDYSNVSWTWYIFYTYVKFRDESNIDEFQNKLNQLYIKYSDRRVEGVRWAEFVLTPLKNIYLDSHLPLEFKNSGSRTTLKVLNLTSFLILLIAWINYINMATNRSLERAKEVGIRKVHGSGQVQLILQFMAESFSINFLAFIVSLLLAIPSLNFMNDLIGIPKSYQLFSNIFFWNELILVLLIGAFLSGFYPAFVISRFKPILVLKGKFKNSKSSLVLRKGLAIIQFIVSFLLIVATILIYKQINFMQNQPLGFDIDKTLIITSPRSGNDYEFEVRKQTFKQKLKEYPAIKDIAASTYTPGMPIVWSLASRWTRTPPEVTQTLYCIQADSNYFNLYKIPFIEGRNFQISDTNKGVINETALDLLGFEDAESALHETVLVWTDSIEIVGVVKDFHQQSLEKPIYPIVFMSNPNRRGYYSIKVENSNWTNIIRNIEKHWKEIYPADPFEYSFLDDQFNLQYQNHVKFGKILTIFSGLSIFISCLGLYVFASYNVLQRMKEIGIRKVLGANTISIYFIFFKEFLLVILWGLIISFPILLFSSQKWLSQFAYKTSLSFIDFVLAFFLVLVLVLGTITYEIYKATLVNSALTLKQE